MVTEGKMIEKCYKILYLTVCNFVLLLYLLDAVTERMLTSMRVRRVFSCARVGVK